MLADFDFSVVYGDAVRFMVYRLPKVVLIVILAFIAVRLLRYMLGRFGRYVDENEEMISDRKKAKTLIGILSNIGAVAIYTIGVITILNELNINITPIIAGVGILGLAVGFGAQTIVKDFITGFFVLLENQYSVGDYIKIGDKAGTVESITLRITRLRDFEGMVHFIPNGEIADVSNFSKEWGRAILDFQVPYKEDLARVMQALRDISESMFKDQLCGPMLVESPQVLGVEALGDSAVTLRVIAKTQHGSKFDVLREFRLRAKNRFDELGIDTPKVENAVWLMDTAAAGAAAN